MEISLDQLRLVLFNRTTDNRLRVSADDMLECVGLPAEIAAAIKAADPNELHFHVEPVGNGLSAVWNARHWAESTTKAWMRVMTSAIVDPAKYEEAMRLPLIVDRIAMACGASVRPAAEVAVKLLAAKGEQYLKAEMEKFSASNNGAVFYIPPKEIPPDITTSAVVAEYEGKYAGGTAAAAVIRLAEATADANPERRDDIELLYEHNRE